MEAASYLLFRLCDAVYAVPATAVVEILPLPQISRLDEVPKYVVGMANIRGQFVPVIDLNIRFGHVPKPYRIDQCLLVLKGDGPAIGVIVDAAESVCDFAADEIVTASSYGSDPAEAGSQFIQGVVRMGERIVMLLNLEHLLSLGQSLEELYGPPAFTPGDASFSSSNPEELAVFKERSHRLAQPLESEEGTGLLPLALVRIGSELFGVELNAIREFADLRNVTPVPCCPEHIVGQMNLRGELITVLDVSSALGLPSRGDRANRKVVVMESSELAGGVLVDDLLDVLYLNSAELSPVPRALRETGHEHLRGAATYGTRMFSLIDLPALLTNGSLAVNENP